MKPKSARRYWERLNTFLQEAEAEGVVKKDNLDLLQVHIPRNNPELGLAEPFIGYVLNDQTKEVWELEVLDEDNDEIMILRYHSGEVEKGEIFYYFEIDPEDEPETKEKSPATVDKDVKTQAD